MEFSLVATAELLSLIEKSANSLQELKQRELAVLVP